MEMFVLMGVAMYAWDRLLRFIWTFVPRRATVCREKANVAQVRFPKNPITRS